LGRSIRRRGAAWPRGGPLGEGDGDIYHHKHCLCRASEVTTLKFLKLCLSSRKMLRTINILPPICCTVSLNQKHPPGGAGGISEESRNRGLDSVSDMYLGCVFLFCVRSPVEFGNTILNTRGYCSLYSRPSQLFIMAIIRYVANGSVVHGSMS
jgi:hypothetical protein